MSNAILERIRQVQGNLVRTFNVQQTYADKNDMCTRILAAEAFAILSRTSRQKMYSPGQLIFGRDTILPIKHRVDWELIRQKKQTKINRDNTRENKHRVDYDYKVRDNVMLTNHTAYKYETPYNALFVMTQCFNNGTVMLQYYAKQSRHNIRRIKPYKLDTKVGDLISKNMSDDVSRYGNYRVITLFSPW